MKVLHVFNEIKFSGAETMYHNAATRFQAENVELVAFNTSANLGDFSVNFEKVNIKVYHRPLIFFPLSTQWILYYKRLATFLTQEKIDVVHIHRSNVYFFAVIAWTLNIRCIKTYHNIFKNKWYTLPYGIIVRFILREFFNTTFQTIGTSVYQNELDYYKNPSVKINNWFDESKFYPALSFEERLTYRSELGVSKHSFVIVSVGACSLVKNHFDIIKALKIVNETVDCVYIHLGCGDTEKLEKQLAIDLGVDHKFYCFGNQSDVRKYLVSADVFVMTSKFEGLTIAGLEAMACGLASILYDSPGLRDLIVLGKDENGFLISPKYTLLAEKIIFLSKNLSILRIMSNNALLFVNSNFSMNKAICKILHLYRNGNDKVLN